MFPYAPLLCWLIPILAALITPLFGAFRRRFSSYLAVFSIGMSAVFSLSMIPDIYFNTVAAEQSYYVVPWISNSLFQVSVYIDSLSVLLASVVACIGLLVTLFSVAYMQKEKSLVRFWFLIQLFIGAYLVIVMAENLLFMFIGWELVGLCCTGLAAFWFSDSDKAHAGLRTFMILRVADALLLAALLMIYATPPHTLSLVELARNSGWMGELAKSGLLFATAFMFFAGAIGKGAQFPLQEWLPDALAASPSSFNALTECLAGPFIVARFLPIFHGGIEYGGMIEFFLVMAFVGTLTAIVSALIAAVQTNVFKVLAYSISSVIGYMIAALGLAGLMVDISAGYLAGTFLLVVDAFVSALLFLSAAFISYIVGSDKLHSMSGFKSRIAHRSMEVGALAVAGIPPLSGFVCTNWVQTVALSFAEEASAGGQYGMTVSGYVIFFLLIGGGGITAFYGLRMMGLIFGKANHTSRKIIPRRIPSLMRLSLVVTLGATAFIDFLALLLIPSFSKFFQPLLQRQMFSNVFEVLDYVIISNSTILTCVAVAIGGFSAYILYFTHRVDPVRVIDEHSSLKRIHALLRNRFYIDTIYYRVFAYPAIALSEELFRIAEYEGIEKLTYSISTPLNRVSKTGFAKLELGIINTFNDSIGRFFKRISIAAYRKLEVGGINTFNDSIGRFFKRISIAVYQKLELGGIDTFNYLAANAITSFCQRFRKTHSGVLSHNMLAVSVGIVLLVLLIFIFGGLTP